MEVLEHCGSGNRTAEPPNRAFAAGIRGFQACGVRVSDVCRPEIKESLEIPGHGDQRPFTGDAVQSAQMKLTET